MTTENVYAMNHAREKRAESAEPRSAMGNLSWLVGVCPLDVIHYRMQMYPLRVLVVAAITLANGAAISRECSSSSPTEAGILLYKQHYNFIHFGAESPPLSSALQTLVAANITQKLKAGDVGAINWDFWTDAQDGDASPEPSASLLSQQGDIAVVRLRYQFPLSPESQPQTKLTDVSLQLNGAGCWLADDLTHNGLSLQALLRRGTADGVAR